MQLINASLMKTPDAEARTATRSANVQLLVVNESRHVVAAGGRWAVKDEGTQTVREATFGRTPPGKHEERFVTLPPDSSGECSTSEPRMVPARGPRPTVATTRKQSN